MKEVSNKDTKPEVTTPETTTESPEKKAAKDDFSAELDKKYESSVSPNKKSGGETKDATDTNKEDVKAKDAGLSDKEKEALKNETGWSDNVVNSIKSPEEAKVYRDAGLKQSEVNGKDCLIRQDLNMDQKDEFGKTNRERMADGNAPLTPSGEKVELHHIGQKADSPLAELTMKEHRGKGNDTVLHDKTKESEIDRPAFDKERKEHWESRSDT